MSKKDIEKGFPDFEQWLKNALKEKHTISNELRGVLESFFNNALRKEYDFESTLKAFKSVLGFEFDKNTIKCCELAFNAGSMRFLFENSVEMGTEEDEKLNNNNELPF